MIYPANTPSKSYSWTGSISATFSGSGDSIEVTVTKTPNPGDVARGTLTGSTGYFFVLDTATGSTLPGCEVTVSNVAATGTVASSSNPENCVGLPITASP